MKIPEVILVEVNHAPGMLAKVLAVVGEVGLTIEGLVMRTRTQDKTVWELTIELNEDENLDLTQKISALECAEVIGFSDRVFDLHRGGKIETVSKHKTRSMQTLRDIYTPGVARVCLAIEKNPHLAAEFTGIPNTVAIVTNGTAILGLGDIGPVAGMPVMEGKAALFNQLAGLSGVPILIESKDTEEIIRTVKAIAPTFGSIQLEDIAAPECFEIERRLKEELDIPVLHDDQHGTAVVVLAAMLSAGRNVKRDIKESVIGQIGLGAAGLGITSLLIEYGAKKVYGADLNEAALEMLEAKGGHRATLTELMEKCDIVVATTGVRGLIKPEWVRKGQLIFALSNPESEIEPAVALAHGAAYAADGKNVNNVQAFPGLFRGAVNSGAKRFTSEMLFAAAEEIANNTPSNQLVPDPLDEEIHIKIASAVYEAARKSGATK
ncbi:MAG: malic enzyme-like NAD(P)-binding protein [SAR324 cluster bacterium]|nr:malic enzyme-like NAD(P)-binding protein [SAR324 cluster bacterium]